MYYTPYQTYQFRSVTRLEPETLDRLIEIFNPDKAPEAQSAPSEQSGTAALSGRRSVRFIELPETGPVAVKSYARGGLVRHVIRDRYLYTGNSRPGIEFNLMSLARKAGINVPRPIAYATRGKLFYRAWLITRQIPANESFAELCLNQQQRALELVPSICKSVRRLVEKRIFHVDLHPGNVLVDKDDIHYIIDFDKACFYAKSRENLAEKYRKRWERAVKKHGLPESFTALDLERFYS